MFVPPLWGKLATLLRDIYSLGIPTNVTGVGLQQSL
jgi:hypothetical protein